MPRALLIASVTLAMSACAAGCTNRDTVAISGGGDGDGGSGGDRESYCDGSGPPLLAGTDGDPVCSGDLATRAFDRALCACGGYASNAALTVDSFDSRNGAYQPGEGGGDVGMNDKLDTSAAVTIGGDLVVGGGDGILAGPTLSIGGDLEDIGQLARATTAVTVGGDARVGGNIELASLEVQGTLTQPAGANRTITGIENVGANVSDAVSVAPPCDCAPDSLIDVAGLVEAHRYDNHNLEVGLDSQALNDINGDVTLDIPCGRFFLERIQGQGQGTLTLRVDGRAALFIGQGVTLEQSFAVELQPGAELDLFVAGHINTSGFVSVGAVDTPTDTRVYIGGGGSLNLSANATFAGNLYAPLIDLVASAPVTIYGAAFVNRINTAAAVDIHYDRAVVGLGDACIR